MCVHESVVIGEHGRVCVYEWEIYVWVTESLCHMYLWHKTYLLPYVAPLHV